ncbi:hypothetical protein F140042L4_32860 [Coprococcus phoceensis]
MDLTGMIQNPVEDQNSEQKLSKEEYAALKKQEREETWMQIDGQAQSVFRDGASLQKFLDFMAGQYNMPKVPNLLLLYSQNPEVKLVKSFDEWKHDRRSLRTGVHGYTYIIDTKYEKDGEMRSGYAISKGYDITQTKGRPLEERPQRDIHTLLEAVLKNQNIRLQIADNLPDKIQGQYIPNQRTIYIRNGMSEITTFHAINRELACAALDQHDGNYARNRVNAQAFCATYILGKRYGVDVSGFDLEKVAGIQEHGQKDPQELRLFLNDVRTAAYGIRGHIERNLREPEQQFVTEDTFTVGESEKKSPDKGKKSKNEPER